MPITVNRTGQGTSTEKITIEVTNGEMRAFDSAISRWRFKDIKSILEFALAIFSTEGMEIFLNKNGEKTRIKPADDLIESISNNA